MPWKETDVTSERMKFITRIQDGEKITDLCREFNISRKTGHKILKRFEIEGPIGLVDKRRTPRRFANQTHQWIQKLILELKSERPTWGAPKIKAYLERKHSGIKFPARSTVHALLDANGLVKKRRRRRYKASGTNLRATNNPNDLWCVDFKGEFRLGNKKYCYPLTVTDHKTRFLLECEALESTKEDPTIEAFKHVFREYGLPHAIRSDNGVPFSTRTLFGLSKLSVWWLRLGIKIERIKPGHPEQNGRHERMHLTLKQDTIKPPCDNLFQQQERFDNYKIEFNTERPHEALGMKTPSDFYKKSTKVFPEHLPEIEYPFHDRTQLVTNCGIVHLKNRKRFFLSSVFGGQPVGLSEVDDDLWLVSFMDFDLGYYDLKEKEFAVLDTAFPS